MTRLLRQIFYGLVIASLFLAMRTTAQQGARNGEWRVYGGDEASTRYSPLDQINRDNIKNMRVAWVWKSDSLMPNPQSGSETTPIMVNGVLYFTMDQRRYVIAADAGTGETLWLYRPNEGERFTQAPRKVHRGVSYWTDGRGDERIVFVSPGFQLIALNAKTGDPIPNFGNAGIVDLFKELDLDYKGDPTGKIGNSSPVVISHDTIVVGPALLPGSRSNKSNVKGDVMAFDVRSGKKKWVFHTVPRKGEPGYETWLNGSAEYSGNAGVWGPFSVDTDLGYVYLNIESATNDPYGGSRPGNNLFSDSLACVDIRTGKMIWYYQLVHHDIWDYDMPPHPILVDLNIDGRPVKAVVQLSKQAFAYAFDRVTGRPVWPIEERPVPQTDAKGEWTSPTQPFPIKLPAFDLQGVNPDNIIDFTPALKQTALQLLEGYKIGPIFTPPPAAAGPGGSKGLVQVPGYNGGANWQSGAADPETGFVYVGSATNPRVVLLTPNANPTPTPGVNNACCDSDYLMGGESPQLPNGLRLMKPPYGRITAYDMNRGAIAWQIPNGDTPPNIARNLAAAGLTNIPPTGSPSQAGLLVTKNFLFAGEGADGQALFHAYDKKTGENLWQAKLPAGPQTALPMTYMHRGNQYVVLATAGPQGGGAQLVAWTVAPPPAAAGGQRGGPPQ
ncbi:MAG TPA: PQQ-binding-like beta-propeller repeat protein [Terriglobia bacterium]|nr:PQQ-binding-like beta-propeller repeat protein [Terriglobia bacterium]